jgi:membrane dipeptidase
MLAVADAHLDIAWSSLKHGRDFVAGHPDSALGLPELLAGGVTLACATIFTADHGDEETPQELAQRQLAYYDALPSRSGGRVVWPADAMDVGTCRPGERICLTGLLEGCDSLDSVEDLEPLYRRGVRVVGLAWNGRNRWASGCNAEGGLSSEGAALVRAIDRRKMVHDLSHLSRAAADDLLATARGPVLASHVGADAVFPHERNITDAHLAEIAKRGGVAALVLYGKFLAPDRATLDDVMRHLLHMLEVCGPDAVAIGSDFDGGFGKEDLPAGIRTAADLPRLGEELEKRGVSRNDVAKVLGGNLRRVLTAVM